MDQILNFSNKFTEDYISLLFQLFFPWLLKKIEFPLIFQLYKYNFWCNICLKASNIFLMGCLYIIDLEVFFTNARDQVCFVLFVFMNFKYSKLYLLLYAFFLSFYCSSFLAALAAYGSSRPRVWTWTTAATTVTTLDPYPLGHQRTPQVFFNKQNFLSIVECAI